MKFGGCVDLRSDVGVQIDPVLAAKCDRRMEFWGRLFDNSSCMFEQERCFLPQARGVIKLGVGIAEKHVSSTAYA